MDELSQAKAIVYRLFRYRPRSEFEIRQKLKQKLLEPDVIDQAVVYFTDIEMVDDRAFARAWIQARLNRSFGRARIVRELRQKGIDHQIIDEELAENRNDHDELASAIELARKRKQFYNPMVDRLKVKQRIYQYLLRRGHSYAAARKALEYL